MEERLHQNTITREDKSVKIKHTRHGIVEDVISESTQWADSWVKDGARYHGYDGWRAVKEPVEVDVTGEIEPWKVGCALLFKRHDETIDFQPNRYTFSKVECYEVPAESRLMGYLQEYKVTRLKVTERRDQ
jgi:hypothetical protein